MITPCPLYKTLTRAHENKNVEKHGQYNIVEKIISIKKQCKAQSLYLNILIEPELNAKWHGLTLCIVQLEITKIGH
jgi:hypothetical protein